MPSSNERALEKAKTIAVRRPDPRPRGRRRPRREARPPARPPAAAAASGEYGRRTVTIRVNGIGTEWHDDDIVGRQPGRAGRDRRAQGRQRRRGRRSSSPPWRRPARRTTRSCGRWSRRPVAILDRARDRARLAAPRCLRARHQRPRQGAVRRARAGPGADPAEPAHRAPRRPRRRHRGHRRRLQRRQGHRGLPRRVRAGPPDGLRRQDPHPPRPGRGRQRRLRARASRRSRTRAGSSRRGRTGKGAGVVTYNGRMVENLHVESARRTLAIHEVDRALGTD